MADLDLRLAGLAQRALDRRDGLGRASPTGLSRISQPWISLRGRPSESCRASVSRSAP